MKQVMRTAPPYGLRPVCRGAFKFRGAYNAVSLLSPEEAAKGVVTHRCVCVCVLGRQSCVKGRGGGVSPR
jgi:hypothetical protein